MSSVLFVGDACVATGFARATHAICDWLHGAGWDVRVVGINYNGEPDHGYPYPIHPACLGGDAFGAARIVPMCLEHRPDVLVIHNDPWNVADCLERIEAYNAEAERKGWDKVTTPVVAYMPVDGENVRHAHYLGERLALAVWYTDFAEREASQCGYMGASAVVGLGVDLGTYYPMDQAEARRQLDAAIGPGKFIVANVNRNQVRKRMDLTLRYFAQWVHARGLVDQARLLLHCAPTGDSGYDLKQLAHHYNVKIVLTNEKGKIGVGVGEDMLRRIYAMSDVVLSTTQGEGFGLTTLEAMACMRACAVPDWSALGDWPQDAVYLIPCTSTAATFNDINVIGGVADEAAAVAALDALYYDAGLRADYARRGLRMAERPQFRWQNVGRSFEAALRQVVAAAQLPQDAEATC
jgi:D-inositol-3-phosphate glycosyltransferase